jgi:hypothetical protein|tara:strand:- start:5222 stop:5467 length:246 start_codon:yes stop_codon:yes gene_type:complete
MRKFHRSGRLIRKQRTQSINDGEFGVIGVDAAKNTAWTEKHFNSLIDAKNYVDKLPISRIDYYVHSDSNRVVYTRKGKTNG